MKDSEKPSSFTHPHVVSNPYDYFPSAQHFVSQCVQNNSNCGIFLNISFWTQKKKKSHTSFGM